jgi:hypothetical protein
MIFSPIRCTTTARAAARLALLQQLNIDSELTNNIYNVVDVLKLKRSNS